MNEPKNGNAHKRTYGGATAGYWFSLCATVCTYPWLSEGVHAVLNLFERVKTIEVDRERAITDAKRDRETLTVRVTNLEGAMLRLTENGLNAQDGDRIRAELQRQIDSTHEEVRELRKHNVH